MRNFNIILFAVFLTITLSLIHAAGCAGSSSNSTGTGTLTATSTNTATNTSTGTATGTGTLTSTSTGTGTLTSTGSGTGTLTSSGTGTGTNTSTGTAVTGDIDLNAPYGGMLTLNASEVTPGAGLRIDLYVSNRGTDPSGNFQVAFHLTPDGSYSSPKTKLIGIAEFTSLSGVTNESRVYNATIPADTQTGWYYIAWSIDPDNYILETNETNNVGLSISTAVLVHPGGTHETIYCYPQNLEYWTGAVGLTPSYSFEKTDDLIEVSYGYSPTYPDKTGFMKFDVSSIPSTATIKSISLCINVKTVFEIFTIMQIFYLNADPVTTPATYLYSDGTSVGYCFTGIANTGLYTLPLDPIASLSLQNYGLSAGWFALRLGGC